ncbi:MAG TPA: hypothetical protein VFO23_14710, partial [Steroidobacteraceae bacterium]|nr:hypothetical protein [Steroidobacteraceae bacterium]
TMKKFWIWVTLGVVVVFVGPMVAYTVAIEWQIHRVEQLCAEMKPGTPVSNVLPAIKKHGLYNSLVAYEFAHPEQRPPDSATKISNYGVPATMTYGDVECAIWHDGSVVVAANVLY